MRDALSRVLRVVTDHNLLVILLMLLLSAGVVAGIPQLQMESQANSSGAIGDTTVAQKADYIDAHYGNDSGGNATGTVPAAVYVRDPDGNVLSKDSLLGSLRYQRAVRENDTVAAALADGGGVTGVANLVAGRLAGSDATLDEQIAALEAASETEVRQAVTATLSAGSPALELVPSDYEPGTATATSRRMVFQFPADGDDGSGSGSALSGATKALYDEASAREDAEYFTLGEHARADANRAYQQNTMELILPVALALILAVLAFSYRDLVDVLVGFTGVVLSVLWMFGILGWAGIPAGMTMIVGPVLVVGLSVDYGLHVFTRYREERGPDEGIRAPMARGLRSVAVALALATLTTAVGFMSNAFNELTTIRQLAFGITLGVASAFVISVTVVPALKVTIDSLLTRLGLSRRKAPLGKTGLLRPVLASGATLARRAAPVVIVLALVAGSAGAVAWTDLDRQAFQQDTDGIAEWKQDLPGPLAWDVHEVSRQNDFVDAHYRAASEDSRRRSQVLLQGDVTDPAALAAVDRVHDRADGAAPVYQQGGSAPVVSPLSVMERVAARDDGFAEVFRTADTTGDGVPDRNVKRVYDALFAAAPDAASRVVERTGGEYRSVRALVPISADATYSAQADAMRDVAAAADGETVSAYAVGSGTFTEAELSQTADSILTTLLVALAAVGVLLAAVYRYVAGSATLGLVTFLPISLVTALVIGGMWLLEVPLTLLTALLLSLIIGLGIDYNIHISDRFAQELERGRSVGAALTEALTGTGGALLGSTLTSAGAFSALLLHPHPQIQSFGTLVVLALTLSFVVSVFVLPSLITVWARYLHDAPADAGSPGGTPVSQD
ncbi:MAG: RND family transporter [Haloarculaceae archaeon]